MMTATVPAHIEPPDNIELKQSSVDDNRIGAFCLNELIPRDKEFGPFKGQIIYDKYSEGVDQKYSWEVYDLETFKYLHTVDATDPSHGNWMRYVCCARYFEEQNIVSNQNGADVYYRALKNIKPGEELLTWFQPKKKRKRSSMRESIDSSQSTEVNTEPVNEDTGLGLGKRKRKPKIIPDSYQGPLDFKCTSSGTNKTKKPDDDEFEPLQPGQKRRRRKKPQPATATVKEATSTAKQETTAAKQAKATVEGETATVKHETAAGKRDTVTVNQEAAPKPSELEVSGSDGLGAASCLEIKAEAEQTIDIDKQSEKASEQPSDNLEPEKKDPKIPNEIQSLQKLKSIKKETGKPLSLREANKLVDWTFPNRGEEYLFRLKRHHIHYLTKGKKAYRCDICMGLYKQMFSLKRHYLRNHINYKYLSKADIANCSINLVYVKQMLYERSLMNQWKNSKENGGDVEDDSKNTFYEKLDKNAQDLNKNNDHAHDGLDESEKENDTESSKDCNKEMNVLDSENPDLKTESKSDDVNSNSDNLDIMSTELQICDETKEILSDSGLRNDKEPKLPHSADLEGKTSEEENATSSSKSDTDVLLNGPNHAETLSDIKIEVEDIEVNENADDASMNHDEESQDINPSIESEPNNAAADEATDLSVDQDSKPEDSTNNIPSLNMPGLFRCYTCFATYDTVEEIRKHLEDHPIQALCFACDQCNMRFHFKQNLVRHKKVHEKENTTVEETKKQPKKWAKTIGDDEKIQKRLIKKKEKVVTDAEPCKIPVIEPKGTSDNIFKCNKCKQIFPNQKVLTNHVQEEHKDGGKFQCPYCGKDFPSMPNMKKHVRFHLGYRVKCRVCNEIFSNVGALRKHTRLIHPEIYRAKREDKPGINSEYTVSDKQSTGQEGSSAADRTDIADKGDNQSGDSVQETSESVKGEIKSGEDLLSETDITFEAHEIDDGGSRFKYSCSICKKRFSSYINMRRHRRKVHSGNRQKLEEGLIFTRKSKTSTPPVQEDRKELKEFYANVSHNIAINLNCYIDGKSESLQKYTDHIIVEDYKSGSFGYSELYEQKVEFAWEDYNFPPNFTAVPVDQSDKQLTDCGDKNTVDDKQTTSLESSESVEDNINSESVKTNNHINHIDSELEDLPANNMGKPSTGIKTIASVGFSAVQKITKSLENLMSDSNKPETLASKMQSRIFSKNSPSTRNFCQITNGEYANFDDLMLGDDFSTIARDKDEIQRDEDRPSRSRAHSSASSRMTRKKPRYKRSHSAGDLLDDGELSENRCLPNSSDDLYRESQAQIDQLYDSLDMGVECSPQKIDRSPTPSSLSKLCERMLGLKAANTCKKAGASRDDNDFVNNNRKSRASVQLFTNLSLSSNEEKISPKPELQPDYSDASIDSPFYNYESIAFGRNGDITKVCAVCKTHFDDFDSLMNHHWKKHPISACSYLEVEDGNDIEDLHFADPTNIGVLAETDPRLSAVNDAGSFHCTRCGGVFKSKARLHVHIVNCSPIDPVYGAAKITSSPAKSPGKKRSPTMIGQNDINSHVYTNQKRVFTGCRKRTALLLPDSPVKMPLSDKHIQDLMSGYNPNKHIRRRELTELVDTLTCEACGQKFKTIILLERHVKNCAEKEKFKNVRPLTCPILDESLEKIKNICFYCNKNFTYSKSLINHFQDFCPVKKLRVDKGNLTPDEKMREREIIGRLQKQEDDKASRDKNADGQNKRPWQVGRKPKRKGHSWTYIKKRKHSSAHDGDIEDDNDVDDGDESDDSSVSGHVQNGQTTTDTVRQPSHKSHDANGNIMAEHTQLDRMRSASPMDYDEVDSLSSYTEDQKSMDIDVNTAPTNTDEYVAENQNTVRNQNESQKEDNMNEHCVNPRTVYMTSDRDEVNDDLYTETNVEDIPESEEMLCTWNKDANTSLDFTRRYKVNQVTAPRKEVSKKPLFMQCVTANDSSPTAYSVSSRGERSKRKRERCGKVEAFLQNVFKRKKKKEALIHDKETERFEIMQEESKGNKSNLDSNLYVPNVDNGTKLTHTLTDFRLIEDKDKKFDKEMINTERVERKTEEDGTIRYLFKRGRPRKQVQIKTDNTEKNTITDKEIKYQANSEDQNDKDKTPTKRGRPRKHPKQSEQPKIVETTGKRRPGRPPKHSVFNFDLKKDKVDLSEDVPCLEELSTEVNSSEQNVNDKIENKSDGHTPIEKDSENAQDQAHDNHVSLNVGDNQNDSDELVRNPSSSHDRVETGETGNSSPNTIDNDVININQIEASHHQTLKSNSDIACETSHHQTLKSNSDIACEINDDKCVDEVLCDNEASEMCNTSVCMKDTPDSEEASEQTSTIVTSNTQLDIQGAQLQSENGSQVGDESNCVADDKSVFECNEISEESLPICTDQVPSDSRPTVEIESVIVPVCESGEASVRCNEETDTAVEVIPHPDSPHTNMELEQQQNAGSAEVEKVIEPKEDSKTKITDEIKPAADSFNDIMTETTIPVIEDVQSQDKTDSKDDDKDFKEDFYSSVILSPSERVKTNKRSCKKEASPFSPVWVKQRHKSKTSELVNSKSSDKTKLSVQEDTNKTTNSSISDVEKYIVDTANGCNKNIPKALKRKLEIVRKFDSHRNDSQKE